MSLDKPDITMDKTFRVTDFKSDVETELKGRGSKLPTALFLAEARSTLHNALKKKKGVLTKASVRKVLIEAASHGFIPGRHCNFMAFQTDKGKGPIDLRCSVSAKGVMEIINGAPDCQIWMPKIVREADTFNLSVEMIDGREETKFLHKPNYNKESNPRLIYCAWRHGDTSGVEVRDMAYIKKVRAFAESKGGDAWKGQFWEGMALKTVILRASKYFPIGLPEFSGDMLDDLADSGEATEAAPAVETQATRPKAVTDKSKEVDDTLPPPDAYAGEGGEPPFDLEGTNVPVPARQSASKRAVPGVIDDLN